MSPLFFLVEYLCRAFQMFPICLQHESKHLIGLKGDTQLVSEHVV
jgi:hypothetical protein